jgi:hypothetical protein
MPEELEWKTRKERFDRKLKSLHPAWSLVTYRPGFAIASLQPSTRIALKALKAVEVRT